MGSLRGDLARTALTPVGELPNLMGGNITAVTEQTVSVLYSMSIGAFAYQYDIDAVYIQLFSSTATSWFRRAQLIPFSCDPFPLFPAHLHFIVLRPVRSSGQRTGNLAVAYPVLLQACGDTPTHTHSAPCNCSPLKALICNAAHAFALASRLTSHACVNVTTLIS